MKNISLFSKTTTKQALRASEILQETPCEISDGSERLGPPGRLKASLGPTEELAGAIEFVSGGCHRCHRYRNWRACRGLPRDLERPISPNQTQGEPEVRIDYSAKTSTGPEGRV